jgi:enterochelin esterase family protein
MTTREPGRLFFLTLVCFALPAVFAQQSQRPVIKSPEVQADRRVTFRLWAPAATDVQLSGDWMGPTPPLKLSKDEAEVWSATAGPFEPNIYTYGFLIDGVRASDPACRCTLTWAGRGSSSRFSITGEAPNPWDDRPVAKGTLHYETYFSVQQQRLRKFVVYTPAEYRQSNSRRYPVLVLLPGTPGDESDWTIGGGFADVVFDNQIAEKKMRPMIVAMHASDILANGRRAENLKEFEPLLVKELVPEIKSRYRAARDAASWAIAGLSLGGEFAMTVGLRHPELFGAVASLSGSMVERDFEDRFGRALAGAADLSARYRLIWIGCGSKDIFFGGNKALAAKFAAAGIKHQFLELEGFHVMPVFRRQLVELLPRLFQ